MTSESPGALAEVLAVLAAEREITRVLHRYCHAVDCRDMQELLSVYHPDAADEHGSYSGDAKGFVAYLDERMPRVYQATMHALSNISIDVRGDVAFTESYVTASHLIRPEHGGGLPAHLCPARLQPKSSPRISRTGLYSMTASPR